MISLIEKGKITDLQGNILTSSQQSVQNWTPAGSGSVDLSYADGVNHFEFSNYSTSGAKARFIEEYRQIYNATMPDAWADYILVKWESKGASQGWDEAKYLYTALDGGGDYFVFVQCNDPNRILQNGKLQVNYGDHLLTAYKTQLAEDRVSTYYTDSSGTFQLSGAHAWGSYEDWLSSVTKNYILSFNVNNGGTLEERKEKFRQDYQAIYGIDLANYTSHFSRLDYLFDFWTTGGGPYYGPNKKYLYTYTEINYYYNFCLSDRDDLIQGEYFTYRAGDLFASPGGNQVLSQDWIFSATSYNGSVKQPKMHFWGTYEDFIVKQYNYLLTLSTRSTTGFTKDASKHDITFTNGNNTYTLEVNPTASQEYQQQNILFTPTSASCSLKLDLSGMQGSGIEIDVKDIGVYEIGGEE